MVCRRADPPHRIRDPVDFPEPGRVQYADLLRGHRAVPGLYGLRRIQGPRELLLLRGAGRAAEEGVDFLRAAAVSRFHQPVPLYPEDSRQPKRLKPDTGDCPHCLIRHRGQSPVSY